MSKVTAGVMLNLYPDSIGGSVRGLITLLSKVEFQNLFSSCYMLPSIFNTDLDRGFSIIDYSLNRMYSTEQELQEISNLGIDYKFDFVLNHLSVLSPQFQDMIEYGKDSKFKNFFINWNEFWHGCGEIDDKGVLIPDDTLLKEMFFRKPGLPILSVRFPDGSEVPYWNTFYQQVSYPKVSVQELIRQLGYQYTEAQCAVQSIDSAFDSGKVPEEMELPNCLGKQDELRAYLESRRQYLGQMDLNVKSPLVWEFYEETLTKLASYGATIVRLDAFAYAAKEVGSRNFFNIPDTWDHLDRLKTMADRHGITLLPEIHSKYGDQLHKEICNRGYMTYDFFLPGLIIDGCERHTAELIARWAQEIIDNRMQVVHMLGCHDGIPLLDLQGLLADEKIEDLIDIVVSRGGHVKDLHGAKKVYYQVNATYYSALGESDTKMEFARAIQMFMPGKPQVWYLDLFAGKNDYEALAHAGAGGHKEINRTNYSMQDVEAVLDTPVVRNQIELIRLRNTHKAFSFESDVQIELRSTHLLEITHRCGDYWAKLEADFKKFSYNITTS